ncbi:MAG: hypothetical protein WBC90_07065 [Albidovulum sp.]
MSKIQLLLPLVGLLLAACTTGDSTATPAAANGPRVDPQALTPQFMASKNFTRFDFSANGKTYAIWRKRDPLVRSDKVVTQVMRGTPFTATAADDREVQNMLRDAYRAQGICPDGQHPGLLGVGYGAWIAGKTPSWGANVRCSAKVQANI